MIRQAAPHQLFICGTQRRLIELDGAAHQQLPFGHSESRQLGENLGQAHGWKIQAETKLSARVFP